jgi:hypothetical protein
MIPSRRDFLEAPAPAPAGARTVLEKGFVLAMAASMTFSDHRGPGVIHRRTREWIVVNRWGQKGEFLTIETAGECADSAGKAPGGLRPRNTLFGRLASELSVGATSDFLLERQRPQDVQLAGIFFPATGRACLEGPAGRLKFTVRARYSHSRGFEDGREILTDVPDTAPAGSEAMGWIIEAERRLWDCERIVV